MDILNYSSKTIEDIYQEFDASKRGLSEQEVTQRLAKYGPNMIGAKEVKWYHIFLRQFSSPFLYLLIGAGLLSIVLGEMFDGLMILLFVLINALLGFYQEYRSEQTLRLLKQYIISQARIIRDGREIVIESAKIVPGDIAVLEAGDIVPADIRLIDVTNFTVDESVLTGESVPSNKTAEIQVLTPKEQYQAHNIAFSGTTVVMGKAIGVVLKTGKTTSIGEITNLTVETERESSYEKGISKFSNFILRLILTTLVFLFVINLFIKGIGADIGTLLIFSIALAVSVIPEALPVVITFSLSRGALRLAKNKVVVKRLSAIEDLGSIEVLCTDKTGTLTENKLSLDKLYPQNSRSQLLYGALASTLQNKKHASVHSFDLTLLENLTEAERKEFHTYERVKENPFDPVRKRSSMLVKKDKTYELVVRGAAEVIVKLCKGITPVERKKMHSWITEEGEQGRRIIAVAVKKLKTPDFTDLTDAENDLALVGLISFVDPIKKTAQEAVEKARQLGVQIKIVTGDSKEVAGAVAHQIGLIDNPKNVITGEEFDNLPPHKQHEAVHTYSIFSRVSPQQKYKVIQLLQEKYEVGYMGDGINDAPALKIANVALVVDGATDVAREAADIILLQKSLKVIVDGVREGRSIFANTNKYIKATLASNFGNFYTVSIASLFIKFLPLLPLQILLINLLTDFPMIAVATDSVDEEELKSPRSYDIKDVALIGTVLGIVSSIFDFIFFVLFYRMMPSILQTNWFIGSVLTELVFLFSIRTRYSAFQAKRPSLMLIGLTGIAFLTAIILPYTTLGMELFRFTPPRLDMLGLILMIVFFYFLVTETVKETYYRFFNGKEHIKPHKKR